MVDPNIADEHPLARLLIAAAERAKESFSASVGERGLTSQQARVMFMLHDVGPTTMSRVADELRCDASNVTGIADRLTKQRFVERVPDPADRRVKRLALTAEGVDAVRGLGQHLQKSEGITSHLSGAERAQLASLLRRLIEA